MKQNQPIIGLDSGLSGIYEQIKSIAGFNVNILLIGETGTGKELLADLIHNLSDRRNNEIVKINCATLPDNLLESELFGHEKGSFTGAYQNKKGKIELANRGSLFLDEIGEMKLELQAKLLRVLQTKEVSRIGSNNIKQIDFRLITATNVDLKAAVGARKFREDLYYRLSTFPLTVPPLRERKEDIPRIVESFIKTTCGNTKLPERNPDSRAMELLKNYTWPGNIRELENVIFQALVFAQKQEEINGKIIDSLIQQKDRINYNLAINEIMYAMITEKLDLKDVNTDLVHALLNHYNDNVKLIEEKTTLSRDRIYRYRKRFH